MDEKKKKGIVKLLLILRVTFCIVAVSLLLVGMAVAIFVGLTAALWVWIASFLCALGMFFCRNKQDEKEHPKEEEVNYINSNKHDA